MRQIVVVFLITFVGILWHVDAQEASLLSANVSECQPSLHLLQLAVTDYLDFNPACAAYDACVEAGMDNPGCQFRIAQPFLVACENEDVLCRNRALFAAVSIWQHYWFRLTPTDELDSFSESLIYFLEGDFQRALTLLAHPDSGYDDNYFQTYSRGLVLEGAGQLTEALATYSTVIDQAYERFPLPRFSRGLLFGSLGERDEASFDAIWLDRFLNNNAPEFLPIVEPLTKAYPLDEAHLSQWLRYPVARHTFSSAGAVDIDQMQENPVPVQIGIYDDLNRMLMIELGTSTLYGGYVYSAGVYQLGETETGYWTAFQNDLYMLDEFILTRVGEMFWGEEIRVPGEGSLTETFILAPADLPDPRIAPRHLFGDALGLAIPLAAEYQ